MIWTTLWICWLAFMVVADIIANRTPGATFSEHVRLWCRSIYAKLVLGAFFVALYVHFAINAPVWPVVALGAGVGYFVARGVLMRWDKALQGALFSGILTVVLGAAPFFTDGRITGAEGVMLLGIFLGGVGLYIKQHPPVEWDGVDRRTTPDNK